MTVTTLPDWLEFVKVLTRAVRSMAAESMDSAGNCGKMMIYSTFNLDNRNIRGLSIRKKLMSITDQYFLHQNRPDRSSESKPNVFFQDLKHLKSLFCSIRRFNRGLLIRPISSYRWSSPLDPPALLMLLINGNQSDPLSELINET